jgi:hypothetical protein
MDLGKALFLLFAALVAADLLEAWDKWKRGGGG